MQISPQRKRGSSWNFIWWSIIVLWAYVSNFMKIWTFVAEIFAKQYWYFLIVDFQCIFHISSIIHLRSLQRWITTEWLWHFLEIIHQNAIDSVKIWDLSNLLRCFIGWEISKNIISFPLKHPVYIWLSCSGCLFGFRKIHHFYNKP